LQQPIPSAVSPKVAGPEAQLGGGCMVMVKVLLWLQTHWVVLVTVKLLLPTVKGMLSISRELEVKPPGPVQLQVSPESCGPRLTTAP